MLMFNRHIVCLLGIGQHVCGRDDADQSGATSVDR